MRVSMVSTAETRFASIPVSASGTGWPALPARCVSRRPSRVRPGRVTTQAQRLLRIGLRPAFPYLEDHLAITGETRLDAGQMIDCGKARNSSPTMRSWCRGLVLCLQHITTVGSQCQFQQRTREAGTRLDKANIVRENLKRASVRRNMPITSRTNRLSACFSGLASAARASSTYRAFLSTQCRSQVIGA
jgi:hypothetical protein